MIKKIAVIVGLCLLAGYIVFSVFFFEKKPKDMVCSHFEIVVDNANKERFVDAAYIEKQIDVKGLNPYGKQMKDVNTYDIEQAIEANEQVKSVEVFVTSNGGIRALIKEKKPVLRIINSDGESYYIDSDAKRMPLSKNKAAYLPIATGAIKEDFARNELYKFALFLSENEFWNAQIEQIVVSTPNDVKLIPRVGDHVILIGKLENYEEKLGKLMTFYNNGLDETGWNRYSVINLKYDKQVVCTKR